MHKPFAASSVDFCNLSSKIKILQVFNFELYESKENSFSAEGEDGCVLYNPEEDMMNKLEMVACCTITYQGTTYTTLITDVLKGLLWVDEKTQD